ncbi:MAG: hypothetical protein JWQ09_3833 [Segetibacter sp.]|nr:hypothetical protein [Segetibacter sp.]
MIHNRNYNLDTYLDYFKGREDYIGCQGNNNYYPINTCLDTDTLTKHIEGIQTFGVYLLTKTSKCNFICIDIDIPKGELKDVSFKDPKIKFEYLKTALLDVISDLTTKLPFTINNLLFEDTGGRGYHIWLFFDESIEGNKAMLLGNILKEIHSLEFEFFPKQPNLTEKRKYGNLIKLPLGEHKKYDQRSRFFRIENDKIFLIPTIESNLLHLSTIERVKVALIEDILREKKINGIKEVAFAGIESLKPFKRIIYKKDILSLFNRCTALNQLEKKAKSRIKFSRLEAFHLSNLLLSVEESGNDLSRLLKLSYGQDYSEEIASKEIKLLTQLKPSSCKTLHDCKICPSYCKKELKIRNEDRLQRNTNPLSVWLEPVKNSKKIRNIENILKKIADIDNVKIAYSRLKQYANKESAVFFDEFDFDFFERNFEVNINSISLALMNKVALPPFKFDIVNIPKKIDENGNLNYRQMVYASVFDQIVIQAVMNICGVLLEEKFEDYSYGYRLNINDNKSNKIFEDWREKYPQFRSNILNRLREPNIKYYICCDIKGYYDNIIKDTLILKVRGIIDDEYVFDIVKKVLESYSFSGTPERGLPQGPAYARAMANLYLNEFDKDICSKASYYFRYVDDLFILFQTKQQAEEVLILLTQKLGDLGLELSCDVDKEADIKEAEDEKSIMQKMDSLRYGVFEEMNFLPYLDKQKIKEFYKTASQKILSVNDSSSINKARPSLIHIYGKDINEDIQSQSELIELIEALVSKKVFLPKQHRFLFSRIIDLYLKTKKGFVLFYSTLHETHRIYFLLSLYEKFKEKNEFFIDEIRPILLENLKSDNKYLKGFTIAISQKYKEILQLCIDEKETINDIVSKNNVFLGNKFFETTDYFRLSLESRRQIANFLKPSSSYLFKKYFFSGLNDFNNFRQIDTELFENLLQSNHFLLHAECCKALSLFNSRNSLFEKLLNFISTEKPVYKSFLIDTLGQYIFDRYKSSTDVELENLKVLYDSVADNEIACRALEIVARIKNEFITIKPSPIGDCNKVDSYNECHYYQANYNKQLFIEIIPFNKLPFSKAEEFQEFKRVLSLLSDHQLIPETETDYTTYNESVVIKYFHSERYRNVTEASFSWKNEEDCYKALILINNVYKKANKYFKLFGIFPIVKIENLKIVDSETDIVFTNIGMSLGDRYYIKSCNLDNSNPNDISKNVYLFVYDLFFTNKREWETFEKEPKSDIKLFFWYILRRLNSNTISVERLDYLIQEIKKIDYKSSLDISQLYFSEKLRISLYDHSKVKVNWYGVTKGLVDVYESLAITYKKIDFDELSYYNKNRFNSRKPNKLHYLGKELFNLNQNLTNIIPQLVDKYPVKVFKVLNLFSIFCIEFESLIKILLWEKRRLQYLTVDNLNIILGRKIYNLSGEEINSINKLIKTYNSKENDIFDSSVHYSLKEVSFLCLIKLSKQTFFGNKIELQDLFEACTKGSDRIIDTLLTKIPEIEHDIIHLVRDINFSLSKNFRFEATAGIDTDAIQDKIINTLIDCQAIRRGMGSKRVTKRKFTVNKFGNKINIKGYFFGQKQVSVGLTKGIPLSNLSPSHSSRFSYDIFKKEIINIVLPNERVLELIRNLKKGKFFGYRISYFYHGRQMIFLDLIFMAFFFAIQTYVTGQYDQKTKDPLLLDSLFYSICHASLWVFRQALNAPLVFFIAKIFLYDLTFWSNSYPKFLNILKFKK